MSDQFQDRVTKIALSAAAGHGFALGGGQALVAHGIVIRPTEDIDLFTNSDTGVQSALIPVERSLTDAGLEVETMPQDSDLGELFDGFNEDFAEFEVRSGSESVRLTLARFDRANSPVDLEIGAVLHLDDVIGSKVAAMATRAEPRDFVDVAAALKRCSRETLLQLAASADSALTAAEVAESMRTLDLMPDDFFGRWLPIESVAELRRAFANWPR